MTDLHLHHLQITQVTFDDSDRAYKSCLINQVVDKFCSDAPVPLINGRNPALIQKTHGLVDYYVCLPFLQMNQLG